MSRFLYKGERLKNISFPIGGLGTGTVGLAGNGSLIDWEIYNRPNKGSLNGFSHFAIKAENDKKVLDARVLNGDYQGNYIGRINHEIGFGRGIPKESMAGFPHFRNVEFIGQFPISEINFKDKHFPGNIKMTAWNPFIPMNDKDSTIPGAFFEFDINNTSEQEIKYTVCFTLDNPLPRYTGVHKYYHKYSGHYIHIKSTELEENDKDYGDLTISTDSDEVSYQEYWYRAIAFEKLETFWRDFITYGPLKNRHYTDEGERKRYGKKEGTDLASLAATVSVPSNSTKKVKFIMTWNFPNAYNYWVPEEKTTFWKNYYATLFKNSLESSEYSIIQYNRLSKYTKLFKDAIFTSTIPEVVKEAVSANISILKSATCMRLEDGSFYGFEGSCVTGGSCEGSCSHVWNYEYALPFLFPELERSMRDINFKYNLGEDNNFYFRTPLPLGRKRNDFYKIFYACVDGQCGEVIKCYREWKISGDSTWLKKHWESIKKAMDFAWNNNNKHKWDPEKSGVIAGRQHHTLDSELFGVNSWLTGYYLCALKAATEMANFLKDKEKAIEYNQIFNKGKEYVKTNLFNGEYFTQQLDLKDKSILDKFGVNYWNEESQEIKYQLGEACHIDQVIAQWHSNLCGLGEIFDKNQTKSALKAIYKYNFRKSMREFYNPCRLFCVNDESGVVIAVWPKHVYKQQSPILYSGEAMNGFEYQVASHMIQEGFADEGVEIVNAIRERYDGTRRNPWNEFECGSNYVRSMASYSLLLSYSGFEYDMTKNQIGFRPITKNENQYKIFWSLGKAWGTFEIDNKIIRLKVLYGDIGIQEIKLPRSYIELIDDVKIANKDINYKVENNKIIFSEINSLSVDEQIIINICKGE